MGKKFPPSYENIYMAGFLHSALQSSPLLPQVNCRFLDDILGLWPHSLDLFLQFINTFNTHHPTMKVKYTQHAQHLSFFPYTNAPHTHSSIK